MEAAGPSESFPSILPRGTGHSFVVYGDSCSGVPGGAHEKTFAQVNAVIRRLRPAPDFIVFAGDEIAGLTPNPFELRRQWEHWLREEMGWLAGLGVPIWHSTGNHTTYDAVSEAVFREMLPNLPKNGPAGQEGLSYWVRHGDLLLVFVNTLSSRLGGEGYVETTWLREVLRSHLDAEYRLVVGHHPVYAVNGFDGPYQRTICSEHRDAFWSALIEGGVLAYICSHILAFDVQVHRGIIQLCTAGAGTAHRMPAEVEYLHCVQATLDRSGLRYQVLDTNSTVREALTWPSGGPTVDVWRDLRAGEQSALFEGSPDPTRVVAFRFTGISAESGGTEQTLLSMYEPCKQASLWIGLRGIEQRVVAVLAPEPRRSPHYWIGPPIERGTYFDFEILVHAAMGPGGILFKDSIDRTWSSMAAASAWGPERIPWPSRWAIAHGRGGTADRAFRGHGLAAFVGLPHSTL